MSVHPLNQLQTNRLILAVDDDAGVREAYAEVFRPPVQTSSELARLAEQVLGLAPPERPSPTPFRLESCPSGPAALERLETLLDAGDPPAVAFVDMRMPPGWDGLATIERLWQRDPRLQCVICTAYSDHSWDQITARLGITDRLLILKKPFDRIEILQMAEALCAKWSGARLAEERLVELEVQQGQVRQGQRMEALGRLAGGVAHDFNNLLSAIIGFSELALQRLPAGQPARPKIEQVLRAGLQAADITKQLLGFSRRQAMAPSVVDVATEVTSQLAMIRHLMGDHIVLQPSISGPCPVLIDRSQLQQVVINLLINARDAMPNGGVVEVRTGMVDEYVRLEVADQGPGIPAEIIDRIFDPFFTTKEPGQGTGLGLAMVHGIVHQSGGTVAVVSPPGRGAIFTILLPRHVEFPAAPVTPPTVIGGRERILLVDDRDDVRQLAHESLEEAGYAVTSVGDPEVAAVDGLTGDKPYDLLLTDVLMPRLGGVELAARLRAGRPGLRILYMSGWVEHPDTLDGPVLAKPFRADELLSAVRRALG